MSVKWEDRTIRRPGEHSEPTITDANLNGLHVQVHRKKGAPDRWFMTTGALMVHGRLLKANILHEAQREALMIMREQITGALEATNALLARTVQT